MQFAWSNDRTPGKPSVMGCVGLRNMGNTCYLNAILQCVLHLPGFVKQLLEPSFEQTLNTTNR